MLIERTTRKNLVDIANASHADMSTKMALLVLELTDAGLYTEATEDEIHEFDILLDAMEELTTIILPFALN